MIKKDPWQLALKKIAEFPVEKLLTLYWADGDPTQRLVVAKSQQPMGKCLPEKDLPELIATCIHEHANSSPHSGIETLQKIIIQLPSGESWGQPVQIWPSAPTLCH